MFNFIIRFVKDERGATAVEYGLLAGLISLILIASLTAVGTGLSHVMKILSDELTTLAV